MTEFETQVMLRLDSIDTRLSAIEDRFEQATSFASDMISDEGGLLGSLDPGFLKNLVSTLEAPERLTEASDLISEAGPLQTLSETLQGFRERLEGARLAIMDEAMASSSEDEVE